MHDFLVVIILYLLGASVVEMSQTATGEFVRCFPAGWTEADQVKVICNDTKIAQYCVRQSCQTSRKTGVSLTKDQDRVCLTITNCSYDSQSCVADGYIDDKQQEPDSFTVNVCYRPTSTSPSPPSTSTSSGPGNNEKFKAHPGTIAALVTVPIIGLLSLCFLYWKVERFRKAIRYFLQRNKKNPKPEQTIEMKERFLQSGCMV